MNVLIVIYKKCKQYFICGLVVEGFFGDWNVRAVAVTGKIKHLTHYCHRATERTTKKIRDLQDQGKNITQFILLLNMDGFNLINQACPTCN